MEPLELISKIALIVLFVAITILCFYLIISLKKITRTIQDIERNVDDISKKLNPVLENAVVVSSNMKEITTNAKSQVEKFGSVVDSVKNTTDSIIEFEQKAQKQLEGHVFDFLNLVSAISKGVKSFFSTLKRTKGNSAQTVRYIEKQSSNSDSQLESYPPLDSSEEEY